VSSPPETPHRCAAAARRRAPVRLARLSQGGL